MMKESWEKWASHKPRKGEPIFYRGELSGHVLRTEGALCWNQYLDGSDPLPFIWCFRDTLNVLHDWPSKANSHA